MPDSESRWYLQPGDPSDYREQWNDSLWVHEQKLRLAPQGSAQTEQAKMSISQTYPGRRLTVYFTTPYLRAQLLICSPPWMPRSQWVILPPSPSNSSQLGNQVPTSLWKELVSMLAPAFVAACICALPQLLWLLFKGYCWIIKICWIELVFSPKNKKGNIWGDECVN